MGNFMDILVAMAVAMVVLDTLVAAADLVTLVVEEILVILLAVVVSADLVDPDILEVHHEGPRGAHLAPQRIHLIRMATGTAEATATAGSHKAHGLGTTSPFTSCAWKRTCSSGRGQNPGSTAIGFRTSSRSWQDSLRHTERKS